MAAEQPGSEGGREQDAALGPALSPAAAAVRLGVAVGTLRSWDRRYGIGPRDHASGAHRRYSPADMGVLAELCRMVAEGVPVAEAARALRAETESGEASAPGVDQAAPLTARAPSRATRPALRLESALQKPRTSPDASGEAAVDAQEDAETRARGGRPGSVNLPIGRGGNSAARGLARAAVRLDAAQVLDLLESCLSRDGVVGAWEHTITPALAAVGRKWTETDGRYVEVEHLMSWCVTVALHRVRAAPVRPQRVPDRGAALACAPDEWHSLPLDVLAAALGELGVPVRMFGAAVPARALLEAVERVQPRCVLLWSQNARTANRALLAALARYPGTKVLAAGPGWHGALHESITYVDSLTSALSACAG